MFAASFYQGLGATKDVAAGFEAGWQALQDQPKSLRGTGIVLWRGGTETRPASVDRPGDRRRGVAAVLLSPMTRRPTRCRNSSRSRSSPKRSLRYGLLHNDRDLFRRFLIRNLTGQAVCDLDVFVELHSNEGTYPFRQSFSMSGPCGISPGDPHRADLTPRAHAGRSAAHQPVRPCQLGQHRSTARRSRSRWRRSTSGPTPTPTACSCPRSSSRATARSRPLSSRRNTS